LRLTAVLTIRMVAAEGIRSLASTVRGKAACRAASVPPNCFMACCTNGREGPDHDAAETA
jgi:hypothetical protein